MRTRRILVVIVGVAQTAIAALSVFFACCVHFNMLRVQETLEGLLRSVPMTAPVLLVFGLLSAANGLLLISEWLQMS